MDAFLGQRNRPADSSGLDRDSVDERGHFRDQTPLNESERSGRCGAPQCPPPLGPLGFERVQHRQTLRPSRRRDPQQSPASFRIAVKDLEDPAVQCRWLAVGV
jgi:hypothetical protein